MQVIAYQLYFNKAVKNAIEYDLKVIIEMAEGQGSAVQIKKRTWVGVLASQLCGCVTLGKLYLRL